MSFNILLKPQLERLLDTLLLQINTFGISQTARNTAVKLVTLDGFILKGGARIAVRFSDVSATSLGSGNILLNVNSTGQKNVVLSDNNAICTYEYESEFCNNKMQQFIYDGTNWVWLRSASSSSGGDRINAERVVAQLTGTSVGVGLSDLLKQFYPYLSQLTLAQLRSCYIVLNEANDFQWIFKYSSHIDGEYYSFAVLDNYEDKSAIFTAETLIIKENEAFIGDSMFFANNKIVGGDIYGNNVTVKDDSTYTLYVVENTEVNALITVSEFESLT